MTLPKLLGLLAVTLAAALASGQCRSQTTDGYHAIQVFPVVVDTAAFTQRFHFRNPNAVPVTIKPRYFPANGTTSIAFTCPDFVVPAGAVATFTSLRTICPSLAAGSQFGFLHTSGTASKIAPYAAFSRVANPQGNGFSVEAFPANTFTSATVVVNGIRRMAATGSSPAFQTNCFIGNLNELAPVGSPPSTNIHYSLYTSAGALIAAADAALAPGKMVRLLDVFAIAPLGNYVDAYIKFEEQGVEEPGIMAFCTVQDNTSLGADFRIAKQEFSDSSNFALPGVVGSQDDIALRDYQNKVDSKRTFRLLAGSVHNYHLFYFRHPDWVQCELLGVNALPLPMSNRLEMRLEDPAGNVLAGGNNILSFGPIYLGDKTDYAGGLNSRYYLRVEDNEGIDQLTSVTYNIHCQTGSGSTLGDMVVYNAAGDAF